MIIDFSQTREDIGRTNRSLVLSEILFHGPVSRSHIAERVGLTAASVSRITRQLIDAGLVLESDSQEQDRPGRRFIALRVNPNGCFVAGISINAFKQDIAITDLSNGLIASQHLNPTNLHDAKNTLQECAKELCKLIEKTGIDRNRLVACGITITGAVDPESCLLRSAPMLSWENIDIYKAVSPWLNMPIFVDSIANAKNLTAHGYGSGKGLKNVALLNISLAIGCSIMLDGRLLRGQEFNVGLLDNWLISKAPEEKPQPIDTLAGGLAVIRSIDGEQPVNGGEAVQRINRILNDAENMQPESIDALYQAGRALALCIVNINALLHPEIIVLSGPLIESEHYCSGIREGCSSLLGIEFVSKRLRFSPISNRQAACALAIFQSLAHGEVSNQISTKQEA